MVDLKEFLDPAAVAAGLNISTRKALFHHIGAMAQRCYALDADEVAEALTEREHQGTTGYGGGFAIPHARLNMLGGVRGIFVQLAKPIEFGAVDELPVDLVFALLSPAQFGARHLKALARVSRALREQEVRARLRGAGSPDALFAMLTEIDARDAA